VDEGTPERSNPIGNERLTAGVGIVVLFLALVELGTVLFGVYRFMSLLLAPLLVAATVVLLASGVAMGILRGHFLTVARRLHGPASVVWIVLVGVHVLVYLKRALISSSEDVASSSRASARGASARAYLLVTAVASGVVIGIATVPAQHHWVNLRRHHHHHDSQQSFRVRRL
jgi:hypothetical protein